MPYHMFYREWGARLPIYQVASHPYFGENTPFVGKRGDLPVELSLDQVLSVLKNAERTEEKLGRGIREFFEWERLDG